MCVCVCVCVWRYRKCRAAILTTHTHTHTHTHSLSLSLSLSLLYFTHVCSQVWDASLASEPLSQTFAGHDGPVRSATFSTDGNVLVTGAEATFLWDVAAASDREADDVEGVDGNEGNDDNDAETRINGETASTRRVRFEGDEVASERRDQAGMTSSELRRSGDGGHIVGTAPHGGGDRNKSVGVKTDEKKISTPRDDDAGKAHAAVIPPSVMSHFV